MRIVVTGGRKYGKMPDWGRALVVVGWEYVDGKKHAIIEESPVYIRATAKAGKERGALYRTLNSWYELNPDLELAVGDAKGADTWAKRWAEEKGVKVKVYKAEWGKLGKGAGPERNKRMLEEFLPDYVIAFPGGKGTEGCVKEAQRLKIPVIKVTP